MLQESYSALKNDSEWIRLMPTRSDYRPCGTYSPSSAIKKHNQATDLLLLLLGVIGRSYEKKHKNLTDADKLEYVWDNKQSSATCCRILGCIWEMSGWI